MATYASPKHMYNPQIATNMTGFEDFFHVDGPMFLNDGSQSQTSPLSFHGNVTFPLAPVMPVSADGSSMSPQAMAAGFNQQPQPEMWLGQMPGQKDTLVNLGTNMDSPSFAGPHVDYNLLAGENNGLLGVDPTMIHQQNLSAAHHNGSMYHLTPTMGQTSHSISPATSQNSLNMWRNSQTDSPYYPQPSAWHTHTSHPTSRRPSIHSVNSRMSNGSPRLGSIEVDEEGKERSQCPYPDCGKAFKDLKAHMLTHQNERPEKCPITSCEFHKRGFARKYDRNRHLVTTHYKATIVCGFCPGSGSSAEKSFNRTDMFKKHLVSAHGVEQTPSNSKRRTPRSSERHSPTLPDDVTGRCSTCGNHFASPQELFEHFDDCVLKVVTQTDPGEEANEKNLLSVDDDSDFKAIMERQAGNNDSGSCSTPSANNDTEYDSDGVEETIVSTRAAKSGKGSISAPKSHSSGTSLHTVAEGHITKHSGRSNLAGKVTAGMTYSKGGVALATSKGRKKRKHYPQSWGCSIEKMKLKKRVLCVFDGQRRLWKDDMMLGDDFEVRMQLPGAEDGSYVTDLDVETLKRADAFHAATEEERGPWIPNNYSGGDWNLVQQQLMAQ